MHLPPIRKTGTLIKRYKRFLADIELESGELLTVHCPNSGSMRGCSEPGSLVLISYSDNPKRKYAWTLEMVRVEGVWVGVNTARTNAIVREALENGTIDEWGHLHGIKPEVRVSDKSRLDFLLESERGRVYLEVKNCSLAKDSVALFPDAVTSRGTRHLIELAALAGQGYRSAVLFCVQRGDAKTFAPAIDIDPVYSRTLAKVQQQGVRILAYQADVWPEEIVLARKLPVLVPLEKSDQSDRNKIHKT